ncbi:MAG TPA: glycosyltransferase family 2 protein, partial [Bacillota bacterium]|nr:glycosyltransferase family 2 protein [Bacillota bacterium]
MNTSKKHMPLISIITPSYNSADFIADAIESVLNQTYDQWEMIIVDDASTDNTVDIVETYVARDDRISLIELDKNSGSGVARNKAIDAANGRFIAF